MFGDVNVLAGAVRSIKGAAGGEEGRVRVNLDAPLKDPRADGLWIYSVRLLSTPLFFSSLPLSSLKLSDTHSLCALYASPHRNRFSFLCSSSCASR